VYNFNELKFDLNNHSLKSGWSFINFFFSFSEEKPPAFPVISPSLVRPSRKNRVFLSFKADIETTQSLYCLSFGPGCCPLGGTHSFRGPLLDFGAGVGKCSALATGTGLVSCFSSEFGGFPVLDSYGK